MEEQKSYLITYESVGVVWRECITKRFNKNDLNKRAEELRKEIQGEVNITAIEIA